MKKLLRSLKSFLFPGPDKPLAIRILPYAVLGLLTIMVIGLGTWTWEYTNSPAFCGQTCHTMPPQYSTYLVSPHARVTCSDCHIGRESFPVQFSRKVGEIGLVIATITGNYNFPIRAHNMRPARESCELCHYPELFSSDSMLEIKHFAEDENNTESITYLLMKTGGGTRREGLGYGIHWHTENPVYYLALDDEKQQIPYVKVINDDGTVTEYIDSESNIDPKSIPQDKLEKMDCITCHNRASHQVLKPEEAMDQNLARGLISAKIPEIRAKGVEVLRGDYQNTDEAMKGIAGLRDFYQQNYPDFFSKNATLIIQAINVLQETYKNSVYPEQQFNWDTHPNNIGHEYSAGCFRCHDGKHINAQGQVVRLECNLCHSIPVVAGPNDLVSNIELNRGLEPESHLNSNWINLHRQVYNETCSYCHTTRDPGGTSNTSFCSNSACHGQTWKYAGFDAPGIRTTLIEQAKLYITPTPESVAPTLQPGAVLTFADQIAPMLEAKCVSCHHTGGIAGLDLSSYAGLMQGGQSGPAVVPGDPQGSLIVQKQSGDQAHFGQLTAEELNILTQWIQAGAPEK
jgi:hypothetical protein